MAFSLFLSSALVILFLILLFHETCHAACVPSSCGSIHNIRHPFRLNDDPKHCGDSRYNLYCENNHTVLYLNSIKYYVKAINYTNYTIRVVDSNIQENTHSFVPRFSLASFNFSYQEQYSYSYYQTRSYLSNDSHWLPIMHTKTYQLSKHLTYLSTESTINSSLYVEIGRCINYSHSIPNQKRRDVYISVGGNNYLRDLREIEYRVEMIYMASWPGDLSNGSCSDIRNGLEYGIELSWLEGFCGNWRPLKRKVSFLQVGEFDHVCGRASYFLEAPLGFMKSLLRDYMGGLVEVLSSQVSKETSLKMKDHQ